MQKNSEDSVEKITTQIGIIFLSILIESSILVVQDQQKLMCY